MEARTLVGIILCFLEKEWDRKVINKLLYSEMLQQGVSKIESNALKLNNANKM